MISADLLEFDFDLDLNLYDFWEHLTMSVCPVAKCLSASQGDPARCPSQSQLRLGQKDSGNTLGYFLSVWSSAVWEVIQRDWEN